METYLFKFSACLALFWLVYVLFLERQNMHQFKRFYLLGAVVTALTIPLLTITHYIEPVITDLEVSPLFIPMETSLVEIPQEQATFWNLETVLWLVYGIGVLLFTIRFTINLIKMYNRISKNETVVERSFIYVLLSECRIPHSFFKYIFFNKSTYEANAIPKEVLLHEETHAKQLHSLDIIVIELLQIVFWFHPLIYILKHNIKLNHEFLADQAVLKLGTDTKTYQNILLQFSSNTQDYELSSAINYSSIKKRFTIMKTQTSKTRIWLSSLLLLPIIAILFYSFAAKEYVEKENIAEISQQSEDNPKSNLFLVTVEKNGNSIELKCENGCKWSHLILEPSSEPYIINDYGFSEGNTVESDKFTFSIKPNKSGVDLNGLKGTAWIDLSFSLKENERQAINQLGMSNLPTKDLKETEKYIGKKLEIRAIKDKLTINKKPSSPKTYMNDLNDVTKDWTDKDYKSTTPELEIVECSKDFLDKLDSNFRKTDYFLISIQGSKQLNNTRPTLEIKQEKPIMEILINRKGELLVDDEIGSMESIASQLKTLKKSAKASDAVFVRYHPSDASNTVLKDVQILIRTYDFKVIHADASLENPPPPPPLVKQEKASAKQVAEYNTWAKKMNTETTKAEANNKVNAYPIVKQKDVQKYKSIYMHIMSPEQRKNAAPWPKFPPVPESSNNQPKTGFIKIKGETHYYVTIDKQTKYYNKNGYQISKNGDILSTTQVNASDVIPNQYITKIYSENEVMVEFKNNMPDTKYDIMDIPTPPMPTSASTLDLIIQMAKKGATIYYEEKVISSDEAIQLFKTSKKLHITTTESEVYISK